MNKKYEELTTNRITWVSSSKKNNFDSGLKDLLTKIYPDNAHFVYELLQNAEDTCATTVSFILRSNGLSFSHNGTREFDFKDIDAITSIANGTSKNDINKIGKFGVGFKSVFAYTDRPEIFSNDISFAIEELVVPVWNISEEGFIELFGEEKKHNKTYMYFPFKNEQLKNNNGYNQIRVRLENIAHITLLFIKNIKEIQIKIDSNDLYEKKEFILERVERNNKIEIVDTDSRPSNWLRFRYFFTIDENENIIKTNDTTGNLFVSVAFLLSNEKLIPITYNDKSDGQVSIYFPADKETSGLRFHIHAPFASTVARADINDQTINKELISLLAELCANSIIEIKNMGLLTNDIFEILPLANEIPNFYYEIYEKIQKIYKEEALLIVDNSNHDFDGVKFGYASDCYRVLSRDIKDVFTVEMLNYIYDENRKFNIINPLRNSRMDKFITSLEIKEVELDELIVTLGDKLNLINDKSDKFVKFLETLPNTTIAKMYSFIAKTSSQNNYVELLLSRYDFQKIIKIKKKGIESFNIDIKEPCYFYEGNASIYDNYKIVNPEIYECSDDARSFLVRIGVKELNNIQELCNPKTEIGRHVEIWNEILGEQISMDDIAKDLVNNNPLVLAKNGSYVNVHKILLFNILPIEGYFQVHDLYQIGVKNYDLFIKVLEKSGAKSKIPIIEQSVLNSVYLEVRNMYDYDERVRRSDEKSIDYTLCGLKKSVDISNLFKNNNSINMQIEISNLISSSIIVASEQSQKASYRPNSKQNLHCGDSSLVISLKNSSWLLNDNGNLVKPCEINFETIHPMIKENFLKLHESWLNAINFDGIVEKRLDDTYLPDVEYFLSKYKSGEFTRKDFEDFIQQKNNMRIQPTDENERSQSVSLWDAFASHDREIIKNERNFIKQNSGFLDRTEYANKFANEYNKILNTSRRLYKTVITSLPLDGDNRKLFLYDNYDGHCQICGFTFIKKDKKNYFECFDWVSNKITKQNNLATLSAHSLCVCSQCHSILKYGNFKPIFQEKLSDDVQKLIGDKGTIDNILVNYQVDCSSVEYFNDYYGLEIKLIDENKIIHYTEEHFIQLITALKLELMS